MLGEILGGIGGIVGALQQNSANNAAERTARQNQEMQWYLANQNQEMARAGRSDAYGNKVHYIPGQGWVYDLTDASKKQLGAEQNENFLRTTVDQALHRKQVQGNAARREKANDLYSKAATDYEYGGPAVDEGGLAISMLDNANLGMKKMGANMRDTLLKGAWRTNNSAAVNDIVKATHANDIDDWKGALNDSMMKAKQFALSANTADRNQKLNTLNTLNAQAGQLDDAPTGSSPVYETMGNLQENNSNSISNALARNMQGQQGASSQLSRYESNNWEDWGGPLGKIGKAGDSIMAAAYEPGGTTTVNKSAKSDRLF